MNFIELTLNSSSLGLRVNLLAYGAYTEKPFASKVKQLVQANVEIVKRNKFHCFTVMPKRWIVERSFAWIEKCLRLWKNCERKLNSSLQFMVMAFIQLIINRSLTGSKVAFLAQDDSVEKWSLIDQESVELLQSLD